MQQKDGLVVWVTGLSGAGKTTIAEKVSEVLKQENHPCVFIDGDETRKAISPLLTGYDPKNRLAIAQGYCGLVKMIADQGFTVVVATMSLFHEVHSWNRENFPQYIEVFVDVPIEILKERDPKGLYKKVITGEISNVAGIDMDFDKPINPDIVVDNSKSIEKIDELVEEITSLTLAHLR